MLKRRISHTLILRATIFALLSITQGLRDEQTERFYHQCQLYTIAKICFSHRTKEKMFVVQNFIHQKVASVALGSLGANFI